jgi:hypothetical protein
VRLLFLDESGTPESACFAVGGVVVQADEWKEIREKWDSCLEQANWPWDKELKWSGVKSGEVPPAVADQVYECIQTLPITCFVTVLWPKRGAQSDPHLFETPEDTYATALTFLAERFQLNLRHHDSFGVIILDSRRRELDDRMRRFFLRIQREGTPFAELDRIVDGLLLGPSHFSLGLQLADLIVGPTREAQFGMGEGSGRFKDLEPLFAHHPKTQELLGVGLKVFPDSQKREIPA